DAESTVDEMDSAVPSNESTRSRSTFACPTALRISATTGNVSWRISSIDWRSIDSVRVSATMAYTSTTTAMPLATATITAAVSLASIVLTLGPEPGHAFGDLLFEAVVRRRVVGAVGRRGGPVLLRHPAPWVVVRIVVTDPVTERGRRPVVAVPEVRGHLAGQPVADVLSRPPDAERCPVRLRCRGEVHDGLGQVELRLGEPDELDGAGGGVGHDERHRVGHAHVLRREDHEAAGDEAGVLPRLEHARQPVQARVRVRAADRLDERADDVVVLVFAVAQRLRTRRRLRVRQRDVHVAVVPGARERGGHLDGRERLAPVALGETGEVRERVVVDGGAL